MTNSTRPNQQPEDTHNAPLERVFAKIVTPFEEFIHDEAASGLLLMLCAVIALIVANTALLESYQHLLHTGIGINFGGWTLEKTLHHWINDGLMALFFLVVGLEIKREILVGELSDIKQAALPVVAAIGGMVVPASLYFAINAGSDTQIGWGIPMATDIAFAVGAMVLLGARVPTSLLMFLVALAIVDDLGAVLVIALFYTEQIAMGPLLIGALFTGLLIFLNGAGIRNPLPYLIVGALLWLALLKSGVHATLAGVITALTIPAHTKYDTLSFSRHVRQLMDRFDRSYRPGESIMRNEDQRSLLQTLENGVHLVETPLQRLEHRMHLPVAFLVMPLFALANAGIPIELGQLTATLTHPVALGVIVGLIVGKVVGIAGSCWLALKLGIGRLPEGTRFTHLVGVAFLGAIGFTMSIFISELAFKGQPEHLLIAKTGVLVASVIAGVVGFLWLWLTLPKKTNN